MNNLPEKIIAWFIVSGINFENTDFTTSWSESDGEIISKWDVEKLGLPPSASQLDEAYVTLQTLTRRRAMIVTPFQAKAALLDAGLLDDIEALIADPTADRKVVLAWTNAISFERLSPMVAGIAAALGWTDTQLDDLFDAAAQIT